MRITALAFGYGLLALSALSGASPAYAQDTCFSLRDRCEAACTPPRVSRFHDGSYRRCTASCQPRWNACMATGLWADLEGVSNGWYAIVDPF